MIVAIWISFGAICIGLIIGLVIIGLSDHNNRLRFPKFKSSKPFEPTGAQLAEIDWQVFENAIEFIIRGNDCNPWCEIDTDSLLYKAERGMNLIGPRRAYVDGNIFRMPDMEDWSK